MCVIQKRRNISTSEKKRHRSDRILNTTQAFPFFRGRVRAGKPPQYVGRLYSCIDHDTLTLFSFHIFLLYVDYSVKQI